MGVIEWVYKWKMARPFALVGIVCPAGRYLRRGGVRKLQGPVGRHLEAVARPSASQPGPLGSQEERGRKAAWLG